MSEQINTEPTPEESEAERQARIIAEMMAEPDEPEIVPEDRREAGPEIAELERMFAAFEANHSLEMLHAIVDLSGFVDVIINAEKGITVPRHPLREPARLALEPIVEKLKKVEKIGDISPEKRAELWASYKRISQAVGIVNGGKVIHDR